ncbi:MAG: family 43 glycosylhydrolase [Candidatus Solibacter sp.]|nr:family 43 glycosylhydrolase [Candidatus Solibacter sp.]
MTEATRRQFVAAGLALLAKPVPACDLKGLRTPYKIGSLVLAASGREGEFDRISVDCPFVFHRKGLFHMTYVAFDGIGYQTGLASSKDLVHWEKRGCILGRDPDSPITKYNVALNWILRENNLHSAGELTPEGGRYLGVYHAYPNAGLEQGAAVIGLCRSRDLSSWELEGPCLRPEEGAAWERGGLYKPCLVKHGAAYYLFYNAKNQTEARWQEQTGVAISTDLKSWRRCEWNPIIRNGPPGSLDSRFASDPCVLKNGRFWALYYFGLDDRGVARDLVATSEDLLHTTKCSEAVIDVGGPGSVDSSYAHKASLVAHKGDLYHFYCAVSRKDGREIRGISVARSRPWG